MKYQRKETFKKDTNWLEAPKAFLLELSNIVREKDILIHEDIQGTCIHNGKDYQTIMEIMKHIFEATIAIVLAVLLLDWLGIRFIQMLVEL